MSSIEKLPVSYSFITHRPPKVFLQIEGLAMAVYASQKSSVERKGLERVLIGLLYIEYILFIA